MLIFTTPTSGKNTKSSENSATYGVRKGTIMASEKQAEATSTPEVVHTETTNHPGIKEVKVQSIELADALSKDKPNYLSRSQLVLYSFMLLDTLSKCIPIANGNLPLYALSYFQD